MHDVRTAVEAASREKTRGDDPAIEPAGAIRNGGRAIQRRELASSEFVLLSKMPWRDVELDGGSRIQLVDPPSDAIVPAVVTALLAVRDAGVLDLAIGEATWFFGLFAQRVVYATSRGREPLWPAGSIEGGLTTIAMAFRNGPARRVSDIVYEWIGADSSGPEYIETRQMLTTMGRRGLVDIEVVKERVLWLFTKETTYYVLPTQTCGLLEAYSDGPEKSGRRAPPELVYRLTEEVTRAFAKRTYTPG